MNDAYKIINKCLDVLRASEIPRVQKLQAEILLLRAKRYLLALQGKVTNVEMKRQLQIEEFYDDFTRHCCSPEEDASDTCKSGLEQLVNQLDALAKAADQK